VQLYQPWQIKHTAVAYLLNLSDLFDYESWQYYQRYIVMDLKATVGCAFNSTVMMENKQQWFTLYSHCTSNFGTVKLAILQGSILLHLLFLICIDLSNHSQYRYTDLLILQMTEYCVLRTKATTSRTAIMAPFHRLVTRGLK
jgi:hypothetical protein